MGISRLLFLVFVASLGTGCATLTTAGHLLTIKNVAEFISEASEVKLEESSTSKEIRGVVDEEEKEESIKPVETSEVNVEHSTPFWVWLLSGINALLLIIYSIRYRYLKRSLT